MPLFKDFVNLAYGLIKRQREIEFVIKYNINNLQFSDRPLCKIKVGVGTYSSGPIGIVSAVGQKLTIGKYDSIGKRLNIIMAGGHNTKLVSTYNFKARYFKSRDIFKHGNITIGNDCWIGDDVTLIGGCIIGNGVTIGTKSLVTSRQVLDDYGVYVGIPAKLLYYRFTKKQIYKLLNIKWWNFPEDYIKDNIDLFYNKDINYVIKKLEDIRRKRFLM
jgi:acetyltransferase-like isoleucine patch superfamily enzyme